MSMVMCDNCGQTIDTDFIEVIYTDDNKIYCEHCADNLGLID